MKLSTSTINSGWDLGLAELIEEAPFISGSHPTLFRQESDMDNAGIYMMRRQPSWKAANSNDS